MANAKRVGILTSGGDAPGMNAAIRACARMAAYLGIQCFGIKRGYDGLIAGEIFPLGPRDVSDTIQRGGTILRTARSADFLTPEGFERACEMVKNFKLDCVIVIGGNGSLTGAIELTRAGVPLLGLPGTIDNDLPFTDFTIGFDTAVNTALSAIGNVRDTSASHERTTIIEVMGRECGDIALYSGITGGAEIILVPEEPVDIADICGRLLDGRNKGKMSSIIIKAEGVDIDANALDAEITKKTGLDVKVVVLGYVQRGGAPTAFDRLLASRLGSKAIELCRDGVYGKALGVRKGEIVWDDLEAAMAMPKKSAEELIALSKTLVV
ncbi:MAG: 6-phosphofructokinase [Clostridiales bacterium]|nr:6-phosphofructokinase [Clostridiales bacterium]